MKHHPQTSKYGKLSPCDGCKHIAKSTGDLPCRECFMIAKPSEYDASKNSKETTGDKINGV